MGQASGYGLMLRRTIPCYAIVMISVVIETLDEEQALALTLSALVPAAAEGFVREVIVADRGGRPGTRLIADAVGCAIVDGARARAIALARSDWVLVIQPGVRLETDWFREAALFIERARRSGRTRAASFRHAVDDFGLRARLAEIWLRLRSRILPPQALLAPKAALIEGARLKTARLRARAFVGGLSQG
jgi:glycosyltransferase involved in cell wall biosynthesis